jgi:multicomponent Na+:H+ antiporter subunit A
MVALIGGIGTLVFVYAWRYFDERQGLGRFTSYLVVFAGSMFGLVTADNLLAMFIFWELTSVTSYLLIGFDDESAAARSGALQALLVTGAGGLAMLGGIVLLAQAGRHVLALGHCWPIRRAALAGPVSCPDPVRGVHQVGAVPLPLLAAGSDEAATPVSAYPAFGDDGQGGIYLVARLAPVYAGSRPVVAPDDHGGRSGHDAGRGWRALAQNDLKLLLAQGTVSQLGFIVVLVGVGHPRTHLRRDGDDPRPCHSSRLPCSWSPGSSTTRRTPATSAASAVSGSHAGHFLAAVAAASMAGLPPIFGFVTKEAALEGLVGEPSGG